MGLPLREIVFDTETTGLDVRVGHRVVEIGCIELIDRSPSGRTWHSYFNPDRAVPAEAVAIHGLADEFLASAPRFGEKADEFLAFVGGAPLIAHNAAFDLAFVNAELRRSRLPDLPSAIDTLEIARRKLPGRHHTLDALCDHFGVHRSHRHRHGALLDAGLLAAVYVRLTAAQQTQLTLDFEPAPHSTSVADPPLKRSVPLAPRLTPEEAAAHARFVEELGPGALWLNFDGGNVKKAQKP